MCLYSSLDICGVSSIAVKGTEVNSEKWLRIKYFWTFEYPLIGYSDTQIFALGKYINHRDFWIEWTS